MQVLAILAHPSSDSFDAAVFKTAVEALKERGHEIRTVDLYQREFEARLSLSEWKANSDVPQNQKPVQSEVDDLKWADALVLVFPTWWSGLPAILKGYLDRVFLPGVVFELKDGPVRAMLTKLRVFATVTTGGASWWQTLALFDPVRVHLRALRLATCPQAKPVFLRLYEMDTVTSEERTSFLQRVRQRFLDLG